MSDSPHKLILASAGTGKTFQLTNRFLGLLFDGVPPDRILATTFTRKAAGEILDRVLETLVKAVEKEAACKKLAKELERPALKQSDCLALLANLTRDIDSFRVRTIDAFFLGIVKLFALDLGLPPNWRIAGARLDNRLQSNAIEDALVESSTTELIELLRNLNKGDAARQVHKSLLEKATELRSIFLESAPGAWSGVQPTNDVTDAAFDAVLEAMSTVDEPQTKSGSPNKSFKKGWVALELWARSGKWEKILTDGPGGKVLNGEDSYARVEIPEAHVEIIEVLLQRATHNWMKALVVRNEATHSLLERFEGAYAKHKREHGAYQFDDLPASLAPSGASKLPLDERELDMWFRLDGQIDHLLLDEFQDTSPVQWRILRHIAEEIVSHGSGERTFFCVGDLKQSIYGFRQAEPRLLKELGKLLPGLEAEQMDKSYRSSPVVLGLVNLVFGNPAESTVFAGDELKPYRDASRAWQDGFHTHTANDDKPGAAFVFEAQAPIDGKQDVDQLLELTIERVVQLTRESPHSEIGILTRVRKHIPVLIARLKTLGIHASGEGGTELVDSAAVLAYISLLSLADHPEDSAAAFHVASSPLGRYLGLEQDASRERRLAFARDFRERLQNLGLGALTAELARFVARDDYWSDWDKTRFAQLLNQAFSFELEQGLRASDFVDHLRKERVEAPGGARVRVLTIHASKGLEFDCVILPELNKKIVGTRDRMLTDRPKVDGLIEFVSVSPSKKLAAANEKLREHYDCATKRIVTDALSNLYVAMTRAARRLELLVPNRDSRGNFKSPTAADLILSSLPSEELTQGDVEHGQPLWCHPENSADWSAEAKTSDGESGEAAPTPAGLGLAPSKGLRALPRKNASSQEGGGTVRAANLLGSGRASRRGTLIHGWLEALEWIEEFALDRESLLASGASIEPDLDSRASALDDLERALACPQIRAALAKDQPELAGADRVEVHSEWAFSMILPAEAGGQSGDTIWTGSIDRLVLTYRGDEVVGASVLDYKTDRITEDELNQRVEYYSPQLESYARVVAAQTGLELGAIAKRLLFLVLGRTMDVG